MRAPVALQEAGVGVGVASALTPPRALHCSALLRGVHSDFSSRQADCRYWWILAKLFPGNFNYHDNNRSSQAFPKGLWLEKVVIDRQCWTGGQARGWRGLRGWEWGSGTAWGKIRGRGGLKPLTLSTALFSLCYRLYPPPTQLKSAPM